MCFGPITMTCKTDRFGKIQFFKMYDSNEVFALVWDDDYDVRVLWRLNRLFEDKVLAPRDLIVAGERKGHLVLGLNATVDDVEALERRIGNSDALAGSSEDEQDFWGTTAEWYFADGLDRSIQLSHTVLETLGIVVNHAKKGNRQLLELIK
jgi:hypothetical protein